MFPKVFKMDQLPLNHPGSLLNIQIPWPTPVLLTYNQWCVVQKFTYLTSSPDDSNHMKVWDALTEIFVFKLWSSEILTSFGAFENTGVFNRILSYHQTSPMGNNNSKLAPLFLKSFHFESVIISSHSSIQPRWLLGLKPCTKILLWSRAILRSDYSWWIWGSEGVQG